MTRSLWISALAMLAGGCGDEPRCNIQIGCPDLAHMSIAPLDPAIVAGGFAKLCRNTTCASALLPEIPMGPWGHGFGLGANASFASAQLGMSEDGELGIQVHLGGVRADQDVPALEDGDLYTLSVLNWDGVVVASRTWSATYEWYFLFGESPCPTCLRAPLVAQ